MTKCENNPCMHDGHCTDLDKGFNCTCADNFSGLRCNGWYLKTFTGFTNSFNNLTRLYIILYIIQCKLCCIRHSVHAH